MRQAGGPEVALFEAGRGIFQPQVPVAVVGGGVFLVGCGIWFVGAAYRAAALKL